MNTLLDGGIGEELIARAGVAPTPLWATQILLDRLDMVAALHADYFAAGASLATTSSYALHRDRLERFGLADRLPELVARALDAAGVEVRAAGLSRPSLDDVYLRHTGHTFASAEQDTEPAGVAA